MKNIVVGLTLGLLLLLGVVFFVSCGQSSSGGGGSTSGFFCSNVANTTPVFSPASSGVEVAKTLNLSAQATSEWGSGNLLYAVYFSLREFISSRDEGRVDRSNIYKLLTDSDTVFSGLSVEAQTITEQVITPPFAGLGIVTCDAAVNNVTDKKAIAMKNTTSAIKAVLGWIWTDSPAKNEYGVAVVGYNKNTKDINVDMVYSVDYDLSNTLIDYYIRGQVSGNVTQNAFEYKYIIGSVQIVAKGISQGADNYMLFKYAGWGDTAKYIVVPATAEESYFIAQNNSPTNIYTNPNNLPASVAAYKDWVVAASFLTSSEAVTDSALLNQGNPKAGTIYMNYN